ncbi:MAG TPA: DUF92 domain-containing protein, partial [Flavisolibacter sp.]|nr:DUF92 domain-containing protein [Flavisolibacter sp.]
FGLAGSAVIASVYASSQGWNKTFGWLLIAGTIGNLADSFLGGAFEQKGLIGNNAVNFLNTVTAALVAWLLVII